MQMRKNSGYKYSYFGNLQNTCKRKFAIYCACGAVNRAKKYNIFIFGKQIGGQKAGRRVGKLN